MSQKEEPTAKGKWWKKYPKIVGLIEWSKRHPRIVSLLGWIFLIAMSIGLSLDFFLYSVPFALVTTQPDVLKVLIEAEATILGFFGLIAVYALTSFDNRIDRVEARILECESNIDEKLLCSISIKREISERNTNLQSIKRKIIERKKRTFVGILSALVSLVISFLLSITVLGIVIINPQAAIAYQLSIVADLFLFIGIFGIFIMLLKMSNEP